MASFNTAFGALPSTKDMVGSLPGQQQLKASQSANMTMQRRPQQGQPGNFAQMQQQGMARPAPPMPMAQNPMARGIQGAMSAYDQAKGQVQQPNAALSQQVAQAMQQRRQAVAGVDQQRRMMEEIQKQIANPQAAAAPNPAQAEQLRQAVAAQMQQGAAATPMQMRNMPVLTASQPAQQNQTFKLAQAGGQQMPMTPAGDQARRVNVPMVNAAAAPQAMPANVPMMYSVAPPPGGPAVQPKAPGGSTKIGQGPGGMPILIDRDTPPVSSGGGETPPGLPPGGAGGGTVTPPTGGGTPTQPEPGFEWSEIDWPTGGEPMTPLSTPNLPDYTPGAINVPSSGGAFGGRIITPETPASEGQRPDLPTFQAGQLGGLQQQLAEQLRQLAANPSAYTSEDIQQMREAQRADIEEQFSAERKRIEEEMARRGISASSLAAGYYGDVAGQQARALASAEAALTEKAAESRQRGTQMLLQGITQAAEIDLSSAKAQADINSRAIELTQQDRSLSLQQARDIAQQEISYAQLKEQAASRISRENLTVAELRQRGEQFAAELGLNKAKFESEVEARSKEIMLRDKSINADIAYQMAQTEIGRRSLEQRAAESEWEQEFAGQRFEFDKGQWESMQQWLLDQAAAAGEPYPGYNEAAEAAKSGDYSGFTGLDWGGLGNVNVPGVGGNTGIPPVVWPGATGINTRGY